MPKKINLADMRREYDSKALVQSDLFINPIEQFQAWFAEWLKTSPFEPNAMILSTVDENARPDSRVVLLKDIWQEQFVFYTNYQSTKGQQIEKNAQVALLFYWPPLFREVRIRGTARFLPQELSDTYFASRPFESQCSAVVSPQSQVIDDIGILKNLFIETKKKYSDCVVNRPTYWGGYAVQATEIEFWQGQKGRFHDRFRYQWLNHTWHIQRLAP